MPTKLNDLFTNVTAELIEPRDSDSRYLTSLRLLLRDNTTGALTELTIEADMLSLPDAPVLVWSAMDVDEKREDLAAWWAMGGETYLNPEWLEMVIDDELPPTPTWTITPDGQEVDLRGGREGGLFQA